MEEVQLNLSDYDLEIVTSLLVKKFTGLVFTFEVDEKNRYFANGILVGNCRCTFEPIISYDDFAEGLQEPRKLNLVKVKEKNGEVHAPEEYKKDIERYLKTVKLKKPVRYVKNVVELPEFEDFVKKKIKSSNPDKIKEYIREHQDIIRFETTDTVYMSTKTNQQNPPSTSLGRETGLESWKDLDLKQKETVSKMWTDSALKEVERGGSVHFEGSGYLDNLSEKNSKLFFSQAVSYYLSNPAKLLHYNKDLYDFIRDSVFSGREYIHKGGA